MVASGDYLDLIENATNSYSGSGTKAIADEVLIDLIPYMETYAPDYWAALKKDEIGMKKMIRLSVLSALGSAAGAALELAHAGDLLAQRVSLEQEQQTLNEVFHRFCLADKSGLSPSVVNVQNYLREHYVENIPLEKLGRIASLNPQYLSVVFRKETGQTISEYIRQLRMTAAQKLLAATTMSIMDVAFAMGYQDGRYFSRIFHQEFHQSPRQYRNERVSKSTDIRE